MKTKILNFRFLIIFCAILFISFSFFHPWHTNGRVEVLRATQHYFVDTKQNKCAKQLPNALIIGAPKCGTAALSHFLSFHPGIAIDKARELNFFSENYDLGYKWYKKNLPCRRPGQILIERSSSYVNISMENGVILKRVWRMNKDMKVIFVVCEPVRRIISHFAMWLERYKVPNKTFEQFMSQPKTGIIKSRYEYMLLSSNYSLIFEAWLRVFPFEQLHIVNGDNLKTNPWQELSSTERFLGLNQHIKENDFVYNATKRFYCFNDSDKMHCLTPSKGRKHPAVSETVINQLHNLYMPFNELFYKQCKRKFDW